jgi:hypothetical protein
MKLVLKLTAALAALALSSPALACGEEKAKMTEAQPAKPALAKVEKKATQAAKPEAAKPAASAVATRN